MLTFAPLVKREGIFIKNKRKKSLLVTLSLNTSNGEKDWIIQTVHSLLVMAVAGLLDLNLLSLISQSFQKEVHLTLMIIRLPPQVLHQEIMED